MQQYLLYLEFFLMLSVEYKLEMHHKIDNIANSRIEYEYFFTKFKHLIS